MYHERNESEISEKKYSKSKTAAKAAVSVTLA